MRVLTARGIKDKINRVGSQVQYWNLQESLVRVLAARDIKDKINRVGNQVQYWNQVQYYW